MEKVEDGLCHHWRAAEVVFYVFWGFMLLEVGVAEYVGDEAWAVAHAEGVCLLVWEVECEVEVEVWIFFLEFEEVFHEEHFVDAACSVEVVHFAVACVECLEHVHDLCSEWCHACSSSYPYHFALGVEFWVEVSVRSAHDDFVAWLEAEDVG